MFSEFSSNCSLPSSVTNWVSSPNTRGTFDILWACLTTLFLCTWSVQHPNVPALEPGHELRSKLRELVKKLKMMLSTLIFPEFLLLKSISDNAIATSLTTHIGWMAERDHIRWSRVHSYFANMGGFVIDFPESIYDDKSTTRQSLDKGINAFVETAHLAQVTTLEGISAPGSTTPEPAASCPVPTADDCEKAILNAEGPASHKSPKCVAPAKQELSSHQKRLIHLMTMREKQLPKSDHPNTVSVKAALCDMREHILTEEGSRETVEDLCDKIYNLVRLRARYWAVDGAQLLMARKMGVIDKLPDIDVVDIDDKSGGDALAKFLAVLQTIWQVVKLLKRWAGHEPSSQIEAVTVAYCFCTFFIYVMFWSKPQQVARPYLVSPARAPTKEEMIKIAVAGPAQMLSLFTGFEYDIPEHTIHRQAETSESFTGGKFGWFGGIVGGVIFGLLHCVAWNFQYPTMVERTLWRIASAVTSAVPILFTVWSFPPVQKLRIRFLFVSDFVGPALGTSFGLLYVFSRMFLLVETFRSLAFLAPGSYRS